MDDGRRRVPAMTQIQHVRQQANKPAHTLAHHAKGVSNFMTWIEECLPFIDSFVFQDAMFFYSHY